MEEPGGPPDFVSQADLKLLRDQVDHLQVFLAEARKPWYREPVNLSSALAVLVAFVSLFISSYQGDQKELREKREEFRGVLEKLVAMTEEEQKLVEDVSSNPEKARRLSFLRTSRDLYRSSAEMLANDLGSKVLFREYLIMGDQFRAANAHQKASEYYDKALRVSDDPFSKNEAHRRHAWLQNSLLLRNKEAMRKHFNEALDALKEERDDLMRFTAGNTYADWAEQEVYLKNYKEALSRQELAEQAYLRMSDDDQNKHSALDRLRRSMGLTYWDLADEARRIGDDDGYWAALSKAEKALEKMSDERDNGKEQILADLRRRLRPITGAWASAPSTSLAPFHLWRPTPLHPTLQREFPQPSSDGLGLPQP